MKPRLFFRCLILLGAAALLCAQDPEQAPQQQQVDPPGRVARLNYLDGTVSFRPSEQQDWGAAALNYPLTSGDHLFTGPTAGAEMHIGSTAVRLAGGTLFSVLNLDDHSGQLSVSQGYLNVRMARMSEGDTFEVDTPNGAISMLGPGSYRIEVDPDQDSTSITVWSGSAEINGGGQTFAVYGGQHVRFTGSDQLNGETLEPAVPDQWDEWCMSRDQADDRAEQQVAPYVGNEMVGEQDLANNGVWRNDPTYGAYWTPTQVAPGWAPYRYGHWAYVEPWGWTWMDDAPWGFAPFHYGRWAMIGGGWGWVPGPVVARPVYAPALVAFAGGGGFSASVGFGDAVAWAPLSPYEVYHPYYRVSDVYVNRINVSYVRYGGVSRVTYMSPQYVTCVHRDVFVGASPVAAGYFRPPASARFERTTVVNYQPAREAYYGRRYEGVRVVAPAREVYARTIVVNHAPPVRARMHTDVVYRTAPTPTRRFESRSEWGGGYHQVNSGRVSNAEPYRSNPRPENRGGYVGDPGPYRANPAGQQYGNRGYQQPQQNRNPPNWTAPQNQGNRQNVNQPEYNRRDVQRAPEYNQNREMRSQPNYNQNREMRSQPNYNQNREMRSQPNYNGGGTPEYRNRNNTNQPNYTPQPRGRGEMQQQRPQQQQQQQQRPQKEERSRQQQNDDRKRPDHR